MYISMITQDSNDNKFREISTFYGIRYDRRYNSAVVSTEHQKHDYVIPMTEDKYEILVREIESAAKDHKLIELKGGVVFNCRKGEMRVGDPQDITIGF